MEREYTEYTIIFSHRNHYMPGSLHPRISGKRRGWRAGGAVCWVRVVAATNLEWFFGVILHHWKIRLKQPIFFQKKSLETLFAGLIAVEKRRIWSILATLGHPTDATSFGFLQLLCQCDQPFWNTWKFASCFGSHLIRMTCVASPLESSNFWPENFLGRFVFLIPTQIQILIVWDWWFPGILATKNMCQEFVTAGQTIEKWTVKVDDLLKFRIICHPYSCSGWGA